MYHYTFIASASDMGRKKKTLPSHCEHPTSGLSYVRWEGRFYYTGITGTPDADIKYADYCKNIALHGIPVLDKPDAPITVAALAVRYIAHVIKNKPPDSEEDKPIGRVMRDLAQFDYPAEKFSPARLTELIQSWVDKPLVLTTINKKHNYLLGMFRWAAQMDLVPATVWSALLTVQKIKPGRSSARQPKKVKLVPLHQVEAILPHCKKGVDAVLLMQVYTGMRCGEVLKMTMAEINGNVYSPYKHKNRWRGKDRTVHLGPKAVALIAKWATDDPHKPIFVQMCSTEYGKQIKKACRRAKVPIFGSHQIRHYHATLVREKHGLDAAQAALGHSSARTTEIYAEVSTDLARKVSEDVG